MCTVSAELLSAIKLRVRRARSNALDADLTQLAQAAIRDLQRIGVHDSWLTDCSDPLIREAVLTYVNASFSRDADSEKLMQAYNTICIKIKGGRYGEEAEGNADSS